MEKTIVCSAQKCECAKTVTTHNLAVALACLEMGSERFLADILEPLKPLYDFILVDTGPKLYNLNINALVAADEVLIPVNPQIFIGQVPKFDKLIATIRSREISASIVFQSQSQLKTIYKDAAETIIGNCDYTLFLGGKEQSTLKEMSTVPGKETIDLYNTSDTRGTNRSYGLNYQKTGKELMSQDELSVMDGGKCILQIRGVRPFFSDKFDITKHPRYKELSDYDKKNAFHIEE